jgi:hypothetical protein
MRFISIPMIVPGLTAEAIAAAHSRPRGRGKYGVDYRKCWFDETTGKVFCLVDAPSAEAAIEETTTEKRMACWPTPRRGRRGAWPKAPRGSPPRPLFSARSNASDQG